MAPADARALRRHGKSAPAGLSQDGALPASAGPAAPFADLVGSGQTETETGVIRAAVTLEAGADLTEPAGDPLSIFGSIDGPASGTATIEVAAGATLYAAGEIGPTIVARFAGASGTLELASLYLAEMTGSIAGFAIGDVIDVVSGTVTDATLSAAAGGETLTLLDEGTAVGTLSLAGAQVAAGGVVAVPDTIDGTRLLPASAMPPVMVGAPVGSASGETFVWAGSGSGAWASTQDWRNSGGGTAQEAPGPKDGVTIAGAPDTILSIAGDGAAAALTTKGLLALAGRFDVGTLDVGAASVDALVLTARCEVTAGAATLSQGVLQVAAAGAALSVTATITLAGGLLWVADGGLLDAADLSLANGTLRLGASGAVALGSAAASAGIVDIGAGATLSGFGSVQGQVSNGGTLLSAGGVLAIYGALSGSGAAQIQAGSELYLPDGADPLQRIAFMPAAGSSPETLELFGSAASCAATITGFGLGDAIDIASGTLTQARWAAGINGAPGTLDLGAAGTLELALAAGFDASAAAFGYAPDGLGGAEITLIPCFCTGTRLAAPGGSIAVEDVVIGDRLLTRGGAARRVRWIGRRDYGAAAAATQSQLRPVRIRAGALGLRAPARDLRLSPQHAVALPTGEGLALIPAVALVDGRSIVREPPGLAVSYVHIELDSHDLLLAEGAAVESFLAAGPERRSLFQRTEGREAALGASFCRRLEVGDGLAAVRQSLGLWEATPGSDYCGPLRGKFDSVRIERGRLHLEGWAIPAQAPRTTATLDILINGAPCGSIRANGWRPDLDRAGIADGACAFSATVLVSRAETDAQT